MKYAVYAHIQNGKRLGWYRVAMTGGRFLDRKLEWYSEAFNCWRPSIYLNVRDIISDMAKHAGNDLWLSVINVEFKNENHQPV